MSASVKPFDAWYIPDPPSEGQIDGERFVYVGCVHETTDGLVGRLNALLSNPPDYLIFGGDVTGSRELETFKRLFYNHVYNRARGELGIGTPQEQPLTDSELLAYIGPTPPCRGYSLKDGYEDLMCYQYMLEGNSAEHAQQLAKQLSTNQIAEGIRHLARNFTYHGPWVKTLSHPVREAVVRTMKDDAEKLLAAIQPLQWQGTKVIMVGGNWDNAQNTRDNMVGGGVEVFDTIPFFRHHSIDFFDAIGHLHTDTAIHIFLPYWSLLDYVEADPRHPFDTEEQTHRFTRALHFLSGARLSNKAVIVVAHAEPNWQVHNLTSVTEPTGDRKKSISRLGELLVMLQPDEVIYAHQHNLLHDAIGRELPPNTKYILQCPTDDNDTHLGLIPDTSRFGQPGQIIASYVPYQRLASLTIPLHGSRRPKIFGGSREPTYVR